jgi:branched-chain amino acid aminotransferase
VCVKLLSTLKGIQQGKIEDKQGWMFKVDRPEMWGKNGEKGNKGSVDQLP